MEGGKAQDVRHYEGVPYEIQEVLKMKEIINRTW